MIPILIPSNQETYSYISFDYISEYQSETIDNPYTYRWEPAIETFGTLESSFVPEITSLTNSALNTIKKAQCPQVVKDGENLLSIIRRMMVILQRRGFNLPSLDVFNTDDESISLECSFGNLKVGFNIEREREDSVWYMVGNREFGHLNASGYISILDTDRLVVWFFCFILAFLEPYEITGELP